MNKYYAVYNKSDELKFVGTSKEVADYLECDLNTFYSQFSFFRKGRRKSMNKHKVYEVEDE